MTNVRLLAALVVAPLLMLACSSAPPADEEGGSTADAITGAVKKDQKLVTTGRANFREKPSKATSVKVIELLDAGVTVTAIDDGLPENGFYHVAHEGDEGWISSPLLRAVANGGTSGTGGTGPWSCDGRANTKRPSQGAYAAITSFGCWLDANGASRGDAKDNCIPFCIDEAKAAGVCKSGQTGKQCEQSVGWFVAGKDQYPCMTRLRVTNPANGKSAIAVVLDQGPSCFIEQTISAHVLDASSPLILYLFGEDKSPKERAKVRVEEVPADTKLGPE